MTKSMFSCTHDFVLGLFLGHARADTDRLH
jgi:hypothetical protein